MSCARDSRHEWVGFAELILSMCCRPAGIGEWSERRRFSEIAGRAEPFSCANFLTVPRCWKESSRSKEQGEAFRYCREKQRRIANGGRVGMRGQAGLNAGPEFGEILSVGAERPNHRSTKDSRINARLFAGVLPSLGHLPRVVRGGERSANPQRAGVARAAAPRSAPSASTTLVWRSIGSNTALPLRDLSG